MHKVKTLAAAAVLAAPLIAPAIAAASYGTG